MKILLATPLLPPEPGGPATYAVGLSEALIKNGHQVEILAFRQVRHLPSICRHFAYAKLVWRLIKKVDVVIALDTVSVALPTVLVAALYKKPVIIRTGGDFVWEKYIERTKDPIPLSLFYKSNERKLSIKEYFLIWLQAHIIFPLTHYIVFSTAWQRDIWYEPYHLAKRRVSLIDNAYSPKLSLTENTSATSQTVLWVGREIFMKNVIRLDRVMSEIVDHYDCEYKKLSGVTPEVVLAEISKARVLVLPSISEISPNLALEALTAGTPVILTSECGLKEVLKDAVYFVDPLDDAAIKNAIVYCLSEAGYQDKKDKMKEFAFQRSYDEVASDFEQLLSVIG